MRSHNQPLSGFREGSTRACSAKNKSHGQKRQINNPSNDIANAKAGIPFNMQGEGQAESAVPALESGCVYTKYAEPTAAASSPRLQWENATATAGGVKPRHRGAPPSATSAASATRSSSAVRARPPGPLRLQTTTHYKQPSPSPTASFSTMAQDIGDYRVYGFLVNDEQMLAYALKNGIGKKGDLDEWQRVWAIAAATAKYLRVHKISPATVAGVRNPRTGEVRLCAAIASEEYNDRLPMPGPETVGKLQRAFNTDNLPRWYTHV
ncbi:hypothetical protein C8R47DRAFT_1190193 [Mycena vitilis]|nr:hypothetical protein C8R47DRAFT_1190193 [Mycena vitilis]